MGRPKGSKNKPKVNVSKENLFADHKFVPMPGTEDSMFQQKVGEFIEDLNISKKPNKYKKCELCGELIYSSPYTANLSYISGFAHYKRTVPDFVRMCSKCAAEFSDMIETWMKKKGLPERYGYTRDDNDYE